MNTKHSEIFMKWNKSRLSRGRFIYTEDTTYTFRKDTRCRNDHQRNKAPDFKEKNIWKLDLVNIGQPTIQARIYLC